MRPKAEEDAQILGNSLRKAEKNRLENRFLNGLALPSLSLHPKTSVCQMDSRRRWRTGAQCGKWASQPGLCAPGCLVAAWHVPPAALRLKSSLCPFISDFNALAAGLGDSGVKALLPERWRWRAPNPGEQMSAWSSGKGEKNNPKHQKATQMVKNGWRAQLSWQGACGH